MGDALENSDTWKAARVLTQYLYSLCRHDSTARDFGLRDQLQRAAVSVMNNVTEGGKPFIPPKSGKPITLHAGLVGRFGR